MKSVWIIDTAKKYDCSIIRKDEILVIAVTYLAGHIYKSLNDSGFVWELSTDDQERIQQLRQNLMRL